MICYQIITRSLDNKTIEEISNILTSSINNGNMNSHDFETFDCEPKVTNAVSATQSFKPGVNGFLTQIKLYLGSVSGVQNQSDPIKLSLYKGLYDGSTDTTSPLLFTVDGTTPPIVVEGEEEATWVSFNVAHQLKQLEKDADYTIKIEYTGNGNPAEGWIYYTDDDGYKRGSSDIPNPLLPTDWLM